MSRASTIRKKALEHARRQDWDAAIREYQRLAEIDQSNPNLYNELGDIYLKNGNKAESFDAFVQAIDAYARVSLFNNAVAVCKKVLRLIPARYEVLAKLGCIRKKQGLGKEAESYCMQFLDSLGQDTNVDPTILGEIAEEIATTMPDCAPVLDRLTECLFNNSLDTEAGRVLARLHTLYDTKGDAEARDAVRERLQSMGMAHLIENDDEKNADAPTEGPVITEENIWNDSHSAGERITVDSRPAAEAVIAMGQDNDSAVELDYDEVELPDQAPESTPSAEDAAPENPPTEETAPENPLAPTGDVDASKGDDIVHVSAIIDDIQPTGNEAPESEDFRSHYDLGMAYLEMNLFTEAVREYQLAARSPEFQVKCLEMIGLCFLKQNQAQLAIKQLTRGLAQIDEGDSEALGIKYNLGLAYEMIGDDEKAQAMFEDVYVVDVAFRDVAERLARFTSS